MTQGRARFGKGRVPGCRCDYSFTCGACLAAPRVDTVAAPVRGDMDEQRKAAATEEFMRTIGLAPADLDTLEPEDQAHCRGRVEQVLTSPAYALVYLGREGARRLWPDA